MIKVFNVNVYGIKEALIRARYPMMDVVNQRMDLDTRSVDDLLKLGNTLGHTPHGHGDDKFLRQIFVSFDVLAPRYWWTEFDTYGFTVKDSQSTMHKAKSLPYKDLMNEYVDPRIVEVFSVYVDKYRADPSLENLQRAKANLPEGMCIAAGISTNYAQLKTMYYQRHNHRLIEWRQFCGEFIKQLPYADALGITEENK